MVAMGSSLLVFFDGGADLLGGAAEGGRGLRGGGLEGPLALARRLQFALQALALAVVCGRRTGVAAGRL
jgi:hypothetical protein